MSLTANRTTKDQRPLHARTHGLFHSHEHDSAAIIAARLEAGVHFARDRVLAHLRDPGSFPLPVDTHSLERALLRSIGSGHGRRREQEIDSAITRLRSSGIARLRHYGELVGLNAASTVSTGDQTKALNLASPLSDAERKALLVHPPVHAAVPGRLDLVIHSLHCLDKTVHFPEIDGKDEILISAGLSGVGVAPAAREVFVGKFKKDDIHSVLPTPFLSVNLADIADPGAAALVSFDLTEQDRGNDPPPPNSEALIDALVYGAVGAAILAGPSIYMLMGPTGAVIASGALAAAPVAAIVFGLVALTAATIIVVRFFQRLGIDEAYATQVPDSLSLTALPALAGQTLSADFIATRDRDGFRGHYRMTYAWNLVEV